MSWRMRWNALANALELAGRLDTRISARPGAPSFSFPRLQHKDGSERRHIHAILVFKEDAE